MAGAAAEGNAEARGAAAEAVSIVKHKIEEARPKVWTRSLIEKWLNRKGGGDYGSNWLDWLGCRCLGS